MRVIRSFWIRFDAEHWGQAFSQGFAQVVCIVKLPIQKSVCSYLVKICHISYCVTVYLASIHNSRSTWAISIDVRPVRSHRNVARLGVKWRYEIQADRFWWKVLSESRFGLAMKIFQPSNPQAVSVIPSYPRSRSNQTLLVVTISTLFLSR